MSDGKQPPESTEAERLMASLRQSEARLRGVLDSISDGFYAVNRDWLITEFNPAAENYFRLKREEVVGHKLWEFAGDASETFKDLLRAAMNGAPMSFLETQSLLRPDRWVELRIAPTEEGLCVALSDISERRRANEEVQRRLEAAVAERTAALQASEARLRAIIETTHLFTGLLDPDGTVLDANSASLAAIDRAKQDVVGQKFWAAPWFSCTPGLGEKMREGVLRAAAGEHVAHAITVSGEAGQRSFDFSLRPVRDQHGAVVGVVPEATETTARVQAEESLRHSQKLEAVGQLTGGVAHDFNNLLMVISAGLNMLDRSAEPARRDMLMTRMREAVARGATLTRQLLAFSRRHDLSPERIALTDYVANMSDLLGRSLGGNVQVTVDVPADVRPVHADPHALQLAILNLAVNARDAMPDGGVVAITASNGAPNDEDAPFVLLSVIDQGVGMTAEVRARIFEPFFTTKEIGKGSGLGLSQVHGFAEQSGGRIEVVSAPGEGATFTLVLPQSDSDAPPEAPAPNAFRAQRETRDLGNALLVEDDDAVAALTGEMLEHIGWRVTRVASAEAALDVLSEGRDVDLVFSDVMMPGGQNGIELARAIRASRADLPIVLTSGYAEAVRRDAEQAGIPLLPKPFNLDTLAAIVEVARVGERPG